MQAQSKHVEQLNRVERWYKRFEEIDSGTIHNRPSEYYQDDVYSFFQNCHHLKDWIKNDTNVTLPNKGQVVEDHVSGNDDLKLCADICNGTKHLKLIDPKTRKPKSRTGKQPEFIKAEYGLHIGGSLNFGSSQAPETPTTLSVRYTIDAAAGPVDAFELATRCIDSWKRFVAAHL
jgi:hypothetical protein